MKTHALKKKAGIMVPGNRKNHGNKPKEKGEKPKILDIPKCTQCDKVFSTRYVCRYEHMNWIMLWNIVYVH